MIFKAFITALILLSTGVLHAKDEPSIQIQVTSASLWSVVKVRVQNTTNKTVSIWESNNSWGWGNWTFEFLEGNKLVVFVRKPDEGFTVNVAFPIKLQGSDSVNLSFDLSDGTWISHSIPITPTYPSKEDETNWIKGCLAILAVPVSEEQKDLGVWTGVTTSPLHLLSK
jgi:hypothetical protein